MKMYNYYDAVLEDVKEYIHNEINLEDFDSLEDLEEKLNDDLWIDDAVTGNGSGSYTFNSYRAEEYLAGNWDLLKEALEEFGETDLDILEKGPEFCDVTIRCYLLGSAIAEAVEDLEEDFENVTKELQAAVFDLLSRSMEYNGEPERDIWEEIQGLTNSELKEYLAA